MVSICSSIQFMIFLLDNTIEIDSSGMIRRSGSYSIINMNDSYESPLSTPELARKHIKDINVFEHIKTSANRTLSVSAIVISIITLLVQPGRSPWLN